MKMFEIGEAVNLIDGEKFMYVESINGDMITCVIRDTYNNEILERYSYHKMQLEKHKYLAVQEIFETLLNL